MEKKGMAIFYAILAAFFYAISVPCAKLLLGNVESTVLAGLLYLGAGIGTGLLYFVNVTRTKSIITEDPLNKSDLPYVIGMVFLDIFAIIALLYGLTNTTSANASLLSNFEIVATTIIASVLFKEVITKRLWIAILFITISSVLLSVEDVSVFKYFTSFELTSGSIFVLLAAIGWGFENNCTKKISTKNTCQIVMIKGIFSGIGSLIISVVLHEELPAVNYILPILLLGFVAYGLSIIFYVKAQKELGAAKTSAYYAIAPFIGGLISFAFLKEAFTLQYLLALILMLVGSMLVTIDTLFSHKDIRSPSKT